MNEQQDAVTQPAEQPAPVESAPTENKEADTQPTPADASIEPENKVSESVPYPRFQEVNSKAKQLEEENAWLRSQMAPAQTVSAQEEPADLDSASDLAVRIRARQEFENIKAMEFESKHPELKEDRVLAATVKDLIAEARANRQYLDQEVALSRAQNMLAEKTKPIVKEAQTQGFEEGKNIAKQKEQLGQVGNSNYKAPEVSDEQMPAAEFAKKHQLPRI